MNFSFWPIDFSAPGLSIGSSLPPRLFLYCISLSAWGVSGDTVCAQSCPRGWNYFLSADVCKHRLHICPERTLRNRRQAQTWGCEESGNGQVPSEGISNQLIQFGLYSNKRFFTFKKMVYSRELQFWLTFLMCSFFFN